MAWHSGKILRIRWQDPSTSKYILSLDIQGEIVAVVGTIHQEVVVGDTLGFCAGWVSHPKYGTQLEITRAPALPPTENPDHIQNLLEQDGVSSKVLTALRKYAEKQKTPFKDLIASSKDMQKVPGVGLLSAQLIQDRWRAIVAIEQSLEFLIQLGISGQKLGMIRHAFGNAVEEVLSEDPWQLLRIPGIDFPMVDKIALKLRLDPKDPKRAAAAILQSVDSARGHGHLYTISREVAGQVNLLTPDLADASMIAASLKQAHQEGDLVIDRDTRKGTLAIYSPWCFEVEEASAKMLRDRVLHPPDLESQRIYAEGLASTGPGAQDALDKYITGEGNLQEVASAALSEWQKNNADIIQLDVDQRQGAINALCEPVSIITGLPGTGKTTLLQSVVRVLLGAGIAPLLIAPTGMAAKRMEAATKAPASTIHRAFGAQKPQDSSEGGEATYVGVTMTAGASVPEDISRVWGHGPHIPHGAQVVIMDEASMLDQHLLWRCLGATLPSCRFIFVGDAAQLPSVGPGDVLRQMINSKTIPVVNLTKIFRQDEAGDIVQAAHSIHAGIDPKIKSQGEFTLLEASSEEEALEAIKRIVGKLWRHSQKDGLHALSFQVISPRHKGLVGVTNLNSELRELINPREPGTQEVHIRDAVIREGDRVTIVKNDYQKGIFNGDVGKVLRINRREKEVTVKVHGAPSTYVVFPLNTVGKWLRLAYAVTVHRAQGQEFDVVVMPLVNGFHRQLQRNLIYTAITRAREKVILVGHRSALTRAVHSEGSDVRRTLFADRLQKFFREAEKGSPRIDKGEEE